MKQPQVINVNVTFTYTCILCSCATFIFFGLGLGFWIADVTDKGGSPPTPAVIASPFVDNVPSACKNWSEVCKHAESSVSDSSFFSGCDTAKSCTNNERVWNSPSLAYAKPTSHAVVLWLHGTLTEVEEQSDIALAAHKAGFNVISLSYASQPFAVAHLDAFCLTQSDPSECNTEHHSAILRGGASPLWPIARNESIEYLFAKALQKLGWESFYAGDSVLWHKVIVAGHSQGASHAAFISTQYAVRAAVLLSGPQEVVFAEWMNHNTWSDPIKAVTRRAMFAYQEQCGVKPYFASRLCGVKQKALNISSGFLHRNLRRMNLTDGVVGNNSFFVQNFNPLNLADDAFAFHDSNAFNFAPYGAKVLWDALWGDILS